jgi:hypothetical protein
MTPCQFTHPLLILINFFPKIQIDIIIYLFLGLVEQPEQLGRYSDWLRAAQPGGREFEYQYGQEFFFSISSRPAAGSIQPPIKWVPGG